MIKYCTFAQFEAWLNAIKPNQMRKLGYFIAEGSNKRRLTSSFHDKSWNELTSPIRDAACQCRVIYQGVGEVRDLSLLFHDEAGKPVSYKVSLPLAQGTWDKLPDMERQSVLHFKDNKGLNIAIFSELEKAALAMECLAKASAEAGYAFSVLSLSIPESFVKHVK